mmetsp:Transcript_24566/g.59236  ORF Transcript_24566/g.59236 Transcript_24566/m.59236 type:complete len:245 (+) Transcript_24566:378-1112(+)
MGRRTPFRGPPSSPLVTAGGERRAATAAGWHFSGTQRQRQAAAGGRRRRLEQERISSAGVRGSSSHSSWLFPWSSARVRLPSPFFTGPAASSWILQLTTRPSSSRSAWTWTATKPFSMGTSSELWWRASPRIFISPELFPPHAQLEHKLSSLRSALPAQQSIETSRELTSFRELSFPTSALFASRTSAAGTRIAVSFERIKGPIRRQHTGGACAPGARFLPSPPWQQRRRERPSFCQASSSAGP